MNRVKVRSPTARNVELRLQNLESLVNFSGHRSNSTNSLMMVSPVAVSRVRSESDELYKETPTITNAPLEVPFPDGAILRILPNHQPISTDGEMQSESLQSQLEEREEECRVHRQRTNVNSEGKGVMSRLRSSRVRKESRAARNRVQDGTDSESEEESDDVDSEQRVKPKLSSAPTLMGQTELNAEMYEQSGANDSSTDEHDESEEKEEITEQPSSFSGAGVCDS